MYGVCTTARLTQLQRYQLQLLRSRIPQPRVGGLVHGHNEGVQASSARETCRNERPTQKGNESQLKTQVTSARLDEEVDHWKADSKFLCCRPIQTTHNTRSKYQR